MTTTPINYPTLQIGAQGNLVKTLQELLNRRLGGAYLLTVDGIFGEKTRRTVEVFQYSKLLVRDGIVGRLTWDALQTNLPLIRSLIQRGSSGEAVRIAQTVLKDGGLYSGLIDGEFGVQTEKSVLTFQSRRSLTVDGKVGSQTWQALADLALFLAID